MPVGPGGLGDLVRPGAVGLPPIGRLARADFRCALRATLAVRCEVSGGPGNRPSTYTDVWHFCQLSRAVPGLEPPFTSLHVRLRPLGFSGLASAGVPAVRVSILQPGRNYRGPSKDLVISALSYFHGRIFMR